MVFLIIAYAVSIAGNGLILLVVVFDSRLHNPMYYFLCNLSIIDLCIITTGVPQTIVNCLEDRPVMSLSLCYTQIYVGLCFGTTENFLLAVMAYDRYVAISNPLRYTLIMNMSVCIVLTTMTWITAFMLTVVPCLAKPARFCGNNEVDGLSCEFKSVFKLICTDTSLSQISMYFTSTVTLVFPLCFILFSYLRILVAILRMHSKGGRMKAFSTCGSHLTVVSMYFGTCIFSYLLPQTKSTSEIDKIISSFYGILTPMQATGIKSPSYIQTLFISPHQWKPRTSTALMDEAPARHETILTRPPAGESGEEVDASRVSLPDSEDEEDGAEGPGRENKATRLEEKILGKVKTQMEGLAKDLRSEIQSNTQAIAR
ncbi:olfactory receptor 13H1-like [Heteronotia binoei]|uniref:olfactory receptor 13H1-like n=1 Tax=Heteronotia binoei TaxID=13085 RepID=UPI00292E0A20|nr:olfactory receptor 13H1-like [Heteronotia binoei]